MAALALSEEKAAEKTARAEARATAAETAESELRKAVETIKYDFEVRQWVAFIRYLRGSAVSCRPNVERSLSPSCTSS